MAKRIKKKSNSRSMLKLESLEQRQLLATIVGDGVSLDTWQDLPNKGNTYDQVLMTGSSVTVSADEGQWVRTSFVDLSGDIVQVDFTGAGELTISLSNFSGPAEAANYNQPGIEYVSGLASFTIQGADASTHFAIYSVGKGVNQGVIAEGKEGGNHWADVQRLTIVANPANPNGSTFGSIRMGNAVFSASEGAVGIAAANVHVQDTVIIGDIDAKGAATPQLVFGGASQFGSVRVAGGDLLSSNGNAIDNTTASANQTSYVYDISFTAGAGSDVVVENGEIVEGEITPAAILDPAVAFKGAVGFLTTLDSSTEIDLTGKSQAEINALFSGRTFSNDLVIKGDLEAGFVLSAEAFRGDVTFEGDVAGTILLTDQNAGNPASSAFGGNLHFMGDLSGAVMAEAFMDITVDGDFSGAIMADTIGGAAALPGGIDDVTVQGDFSGQVWSDWDIGNVWVGGDLTTVGFTAIVTTGNTALYQGNVASITVKGDVRQADGSNLLAITGQGTFGDVVIEGAGDLNMVIGALVVNALGAGQDSTGMVTITDTEGDGDISFEGVNITADTGEVGAISVTGSSAEGSAFTLTGDIEGGSVAGVTIGGFANVTIDGDIDANDGSVGAVAITGIDETASMLDVNGDIEASDSIGDITGSGFGGITLDGNVSADNNGSVGGISLSTIAGTEDDNTLIDINGTISGNTIGAITLDAGSEWSLASVDGVVTGLTGDDDETSTIGDLMVTAASIEVGGAVVADDVGNVTLTGNEADDNGDYVEITGTIGDNDSVGAVTVVGNDITLSGYIIANTVGDVSLTATTHVEVTGGIIGGEFGAFAGTYLGDAIGDDEFDVGTVGEVTIAGETVDIESAGGILAGTTGDITITGTVDLADKGGIYVETSAGLLTLDGDATLNSATGSNVILGDADAVVVTGEAAVTGGAAANFVVLGTVGGLHFQGATTLTNSVLDSTAGALDGSGTAGGTGLLFTDLVASGNNLDTASVADVVFSGNTDLGSGAFLVADNGEASLDTVGNVTFGGTVASDDADLDIIASSVGDITLETALNLTDTTLVSNLNVYAGQMTSETLAKNGSDLGNYTIGNITVVDTQTKGFAGLSLFSGDNTFDAIGAVGDVTLTGGGTENQQTSLFAANTDTLRITAGVFGTAANAAAGTLDGGFDFSGDAGIGFFVDVNDTDEDEDVDEVLADADETNADFTDGAVTIGDVTIHARAVDAGGGDVDNVQYASGLVVAAGVGTALDTTATDVDADGGLEGTIGDILISNNSQVLTVTNDADKDAVPSGLFLAATDVGTVQTLDKDAALAVGVVIGNEDGGVANEGEDDEFVVIVV